MEEGEVHEEEEEEEEDSQCDSCERNGDDVDDQW